MSSRIDLHMHSTASDGTDTPLRLAEKAKAAGIEVFALTDHDTVAGAEQLAGRLPEGVTFVPGIEFSCRMDTGKCHILGYRCDTSHPAFQAAIREGAALREGKLPLRVTHNDTKLNNVLMDEKTGEGVCIIDLDTVMPGLAINDFGDSIRFGANHCAEDERDLSKVSLDVDLFRVYTQAFLEGAEGSLTAQEVAYLPWGAKLMTLECGMRFLTDHLVGDEYFHISREGQNLDRCRTQCKLVKDMEDRWAELEAIVAQYGAHT